MPRADVEQQGTAATMKDVAAIPAISGTSAATLDREREAMQRQILSAVAHDLKTPLASVIGSLQIHTELHDKLSPEKRAQLIKVALQEAHRLDSFVSNILDMARIESGVVKSKHENVDIGSLLDNCLAVLDVETRRSVIDVVPLSGDIVAVADTALLTRALGLIVDNAMKYGGMPAQIRIAFGRDGAGYINIHDNGAGVPEDQLEAIFAKYTRLDRPSSRKSSGSGLGLTIVRAIMQIMNGSVVASNHPDGGMVFTLRFPLANSPS